MAKEKKKKKLKRVVKTGQSNRELLKDIASDFEGLGFLSDKEELTILPTIFPSFNRASLIGGLPGGCIVELHGPNQGGKTALGVAILASAQQQGHIVGIKDYEGSFKDKKWPKALGLDLSSCLYSSPRTFEEGADSLNELIQNFRVRQSSDPRYKNKMMIWLVDSATAMVPEAVLLQKVGKSNYGAVARLLSEWLPILNTHLRGTNISVIFINQERVKIGARAFEKKWKTACGEALKFYAHFRVRVLQSSKSKSGEKVIGKEHRFIVEKNKVSAPDELGYFYTSNGKHPDICKLGFNLPMTLFKEAQWQEMFEKKGKKGSHKYTCDFDDDTEGGLTEKKLLKKIEEDNKFRQWLLSEFEGRLEIGQ